MAPFFPRQTIEWKIEEPPFVRRVSVSLAAMAVLTGVVVHLYRWFVLTHRAGPWWLLVMTLAAGFVVLLGLTTAHLGNHPVRQWVWRAPLFAAVECVTEAAMSALMIAAGVERIGTERAGWADWPTLALTILLRRTTIIIVFSILLAGVVQWARYVLLKRDHRASTAVAVHEMREAERHHPRP
jgi:hypothetical protein